jgi:signal transduction histidine kinase/ligand-binding sensor domain-containing protein
LKNSNTSRRDDVNKRSRWRRVIAAVVVACSVDPSEALDRGTTIPQHNRDHWRVENGFPGGAVSGIAESADGYLWIGTDKGLVRFDGLSFRLLSRDAASALSAGPVVGLMADGETNLWIRLRGALLHYRAGTFQDAPLELARDEAGITAMCTSASGSAVLARQDGIFRYSGGRLVPLASRAEWPNILVISVAETADETIWMGTRDAGLFSVANGHIRSAAPGLPDKKVNTLLSGGGPELWIGTDSGIVRWTGTELTRAGVPKTLQRAPILAMTRDRESNVWVSTADSLFRITPDGVTSSERRGGRHGAEVNALFADRDGNLWLGTSDGIERFRSTVFTTYPAPGARKSDNNGPLFVDVDDRTWFAPAGGGLFWMRGGQTERVTDAGLAKDVVYSIAGGAGELWLGRQRGGLTRLRDRAGRFTAENYTNVAGLAHKSVYAVHRSRDGTVWAGTLGGGVTRLQNGKFTTYTTADGLPSMMVTAIAESQDGTMWFVTPSGLASVLKDQWRVYTGRDGLPPGNVNCIFVDSGGVLWIGTTKGLFRISSSQITAPPDRAEVLHEEVFGIAQDKSGWFWLSTAARVLRLNRDKLLSGALDDGDMREYGSAAGLQPGHGVKRDRSIVADRSGRVWFSLSNAITVVDPARLDRASVPVPVQLENIFADGNPVDVRGPIRIPAGRRRITLTYAGVSLSAPERVRFRYRLDGYDHGWSEPVSIREAAYTNLDPGPYRFRIVASNAEGIWSTSETSAAFDIQPRLWQTLSFRISVVALCAACILGLYRFRVHQVTRRLNVRFAEQLGERTRIAQELHDTLLQGFISASMQLHVAVDRLPSDSPAKSPLSRVLQLMEHVIDEGRNTVRGLRGSHTASLDLEQAFSVIQEELQINDAADFRVIVEGPPQPLHPLVSDEVYRIGREALVNAFRHSKAKRIEVELEYTGRNFRCLVRDNGGGIDSALLAAGREGHWGLTGMRERAERIGARLHVFSSATAGTEVELSIPNDVAFQQTSAGPRRWLSRLYPGTNGISRQHRRNGADK